MISNSKSQWIIYLLEYILCNIEHIGKSETSFDIRLNNHRKDVSNPKAIPVCVHFRTEGHNFVQHPKIIDNRITDRNRKCQQNNRKIISSYRLFFPIRLVFHYKLANNDLVKQCISLIDVENCFIISILYSIYNLLSNLH